MLCAFFVMFHILQKVYGLISAVNTEAVKNVCFRCRFSFSDILYVVAALYNPFQTCLWTCYKYGGRNLSIKVKDL